MRAGQHLDRLGELAVPGDRAVLVPVGADQIGQHLRVAGSLFAPDVTAVPGTGPPTSG